MSRWAHREADTATASSPEGHSTFMSELLAQRAAYSVSGPLCTTVHKPSARSGALPSLTTCSDDSKPYMILKALDESYKNHIGFAIIRASGEGLQPPTSSRVRATVLSSGPERVKGFGPSDVRRQHGPRSSWGSNGPRGPKKATGVPLQHLLAVAHRSRNLENTI